jgi:hypothetical protein
VAGLSPGALPKSRQISFYTDLAKALADIGQDAQAIRMMLHIITTATVPIPLGRDGSWRVHVRRQGNRPLSPAHFSNPPGLNGNL